MVREREHDNQYVGYITRWTELLKFLVNGRVSTSTQCFLFWKIGLIDQVLLEDDTDNDGYLSYAEYVIGRQKEKDRKNWEENSNNYLTYLYFKYYGYL